MSVFALLILYIWWLQFLFRPMWLGLLGLVLASHIIRGETAATLGFRPPDLRACFVAYAPLLVGLAAGIVALGVALGTVRHIAPSRLLHIFLGYCLWGLFQQYLLNGYFVNRLLASAGPVGSARRVPVAAGALFAAVHLPNLFLVGVTLVAGYICATAYLEYRNLYFLGFAHGLIGTLLFLVVPDTIGHHFMVGPGMLHH